MKRLLAVLLALAALPQALSAESVAITGATIHTLGPQGTLRNGSLWIENGRIRAVGANIAIPAGVRRIDARGKVVGAVLSGGNVDGPVFARALAA